MVYNWDQFIYKTKFLFSFFMLTENTYSILFVHSGKGPQLVQKKKTLYPKWNSCFDAHLYEGRVIQMIVMERPNKTVAETSMTAKALSEKCEGSNSSGPFWVNFQAL